MALAVSPDTPRQGCVGRLEVKPGIRVSGRIDVDDLDIVIWNLRRHSVAVPVRRVAGVAIPEVAIPDSDMMRLPINPEADTEAVVVLPPGVDVQVLEQEKIRSSLRTETMLRVPDNRDVVEMSLGENCRAARILIVEPSHIIAGAMSDLDVRDRNACIDEDGGALSGALEVQILKNQVVCAGGKVDAVSPDRPSRNARDGRAWIDRIRRIANVSGPRPQRPRANDRCRGRSEIDVDAPDRDRVPIQARIADPIGPTVLRKRTLHDQGIDCTPACGDRLRNRRVRSGISADIDDAIGSGDVRELSDKSTERGQRSRICPTAAIARTLSHGHDKARWPRGRLWVLNKGKP